MKIVVLASGSEGNSTFIESNGTRILFDIGKNNKYITDKLKEIEIDGSTIDAIIISHTHDDHVSALKVFIKRYHPKVYVTEKMFYDLDYLKEYDNVVVYDEDFFIGPLKIVSVHSSHDASDGRNFLVDTGNEKIVYLTDTGYLNRKYFKVLEDADYYLMESNHDIEMLMDGPYPKYLKQRILGTLGHLSNKDSSFYLTKLVSERTKKIILMHLSETNNTEEKALETLKNTFKDYEKTLPEVKCARQREVTIVVNDKDIVRG